MRPLPLCTTGGHRQRYTRTVTTQSGGGGCVSTAEVRDRVCLVLRSDEPEMRTSMNVKMVPTPFHLRESEPREGEGERIDRQVQTFTHRWLKDSDVLVQHADGHALINTERGVIYKFLKRGWKERFRDCLRPLLLCHVHHYPL